VTPERVLNE